jgi:hypothetical protein
MECRWGTDINFLNPNDIESMEVLKDASASAITVLVVPTV